MGIVQFCRYTVLNMLHNVEKSKSLETPNLFFSLSVSFSLSALFSIPLSRNTYPFLINKQFSDIIFAPFTLHFCLKNLSKRIVPNSPFHSRIEQLVTMFYLPFHWWILHSEPKLQRYSRQWPHLFNPEQTLLSSMVNS